MAIPFSVGTMAPAARRQDGILVHWRGRAGTYQDVAKTSASVADNASLQEVRAWVDIVRGFTLYQYPSSPAIDCPNLVQSTGINSKLCVDFTGGVFLEAHDAALLAMLSGEDRAFVLMVVLQQDTVLAATRACVTMLGTTGSPTGRHLIDTTGTPQFRAIRRPNGGADTTLTFGTPNTTRYVRTHIFSGTTLIERVNRVQVLAETAFDVGRVDVANLIAGATNLTGANPLDAKVGEILVGQYGVFDYAAKETEFTTEYALP